MVSGALNFSEIVAQAEPTILLENLDSLNLIIFFHFFSKLKLSRIPSLHDPRHGLLWRRENGEE